MQTKPTKVTRFEVIDHRESSPNKGRAFVSYNVSIDLSYQDQGRTLKVFVTDRKPQKPTEHLAEHKSPATCLLCREENNKFPTTGGFYREGESPHKDFDKPCACCGHKRPFHDIGCTRRKDTETEPAHIIRDAWCYTCDTCSCRCTQKTINPFTKEYTK